MKDKVAQETIALHKKRLFEQWLSDVNTQKFFRALHHRRINYLTAAGRNSIRTGLENAKEHNQLVEANSILNIIETYGPGSTYPYEDLDKSEERIAIPSSAIVGQ